MKNNILYIKIKQNTIVQKNQIYLKDVAKIYIDDKKIKDQLEKLLIYEVKLNKNCKIMFSILAIIEKIKYIDSEIEVMNLGETDFIVDFKVPKKENKYFLYAKVTFIALSVFMGSAFTIMTFNYDASVAKVFDMIYELIMKEPKTGPTLLELSYSIGLPIGIIIFFNHFSKFRLHDDPTPITIQMRLYEKDVNVTLITDAEREGETIDIDS